MSETAKYRIQTTKYCYDATGTPVTVLDVASQGDPVVPWAWQLDLPPSEFRHYSNGQEPKGIQLAGFAHKLPVADATLDVVYSSHLIEDFSREEWLKVFREWHRVLRPLGRMVILVPEVTRWRYAIEVLGQCPNCSHHAPEPHVGEISHYATPIGFRTIEDRLTEAYPHDYTIIYVGEKV